MRKQPASDIQPPQITHQVHPNTIEQHRTYKLITPLFGGGAVQQMCDEITTIRGTEIRGHLRFWWRATCAGHLADMTAIKKREDLIWGKANAKKELGPKREETVQIAVSVQNEPEPVAPFPVTTTIDRRDGQKKNKQDPDPSTKIHPYAAFPLRLEQESLNHMPPPPAKEISKAGIVFTVTITFPNTYANDVQTALWAWETFGGIGARTRRGFGALQLLKIVSQTLVENSLPPSCEEAEQWLVKKLEKLPTKNHGLPYLSPHLHFKFVKAPDALHNDALSCWEALIEKMFKFRQGDDGRLHHISGRNKFGRSYWPEAEAVREVTRWRRSDLPASGHPKKFPRAVFGLPIIFHFIRNDQHTRDPTLRKTKDPADATLQSGGGSDRLASPLILKPLLCQNGHACGLAIILDGYTIPSTLTLKEQNGTTHSVTHQLKNTDLQKLSSLKLNGKTDILEAFLDYL